RQVGHSRISICVRSTISNSLGSMSSALSAVRSPDKAPVWLEEDVAASFTHCLSRVASVDDALGDRDYGEHNEAYADRQINAVRAVAWPCQRIFWRVLSVRVWVEKGSLAPVREPEPLQSTARRGLYCSDIAVRPLVCDAVADYVRDGVVQG